MSFVKTDLGPPHAPLRHSSVLAVGESFALDRGLLRSLRFREINVREAFTIVDAQGTFFRASLQAADDEAGRALAYEQMDASTESPARITLLCAVLGRQRMLMVVQKATELGCVRVVPVLSDHSVTAGDLQKEKPWAWSGQALKASRQCRRASVPEVLHAAPLEGALAARFWQGAHHRYFLHDQSHEGDAAPAPWASGDAEHALAVGPEGGWSERELDLFRRSGARALRLGSRILRAETAVYAGLSVLQHRCGDLGARREQDERA